MKNLTIEQKIVEATRMKLRFTTLKGNASIEALWDLPLEVKDESKYTSLDLIARSLNKELKEREEISFVKRTTKTDDIIQLKFDIVKYIIEVKMAEAEAKRSEKAKKSEIEKLDQAIARAEDKSLESKSVDELKALRDKIATTA